VVAKGLDEEEVNVDVDLNNEAGLSTHVVYMHTVSWSVAFITSDQPRRKVTTMYLAISNDNILVEIGMDDSQ
jgi:hypothetical protein